MRRYNNNGKGVWGSSRPDTFPNGSSHRQQQNGRRDFGGFNRPPLEDLEMENHTNDDTQPGDSVNLKLDRLLDRFDKLDVWREETGRKFENLEPVLSRELEPPLNYDDGEELEDDEFHRKRSWDRGNRSRNPNRREGRGHSGANWDQAGQDSTRNRFGGYN